MRDQHLRVLLKQSGDLDRRYILLDRVECLKRVGAEKRSDLAYRQQDAIVDVGPARHDGDVEAIFAIGAVRQRLVKAAMLAFGHPIGAERDFVQRLSRGEVECKAACWAGQRESKSETKCRT